MSSDRNTLSSCRQKLNKGGKRQLPIDMPASTEGNFGPEYVSHPPHIGSTQPSAKP